MASYNRLKSTKIAPIGTILPWGGSSKAGENLENLPNGWIVCNLSNAVLLAADYPLLAAVLGNQYGPFPDEGSGLTIGENFGIVNDFPYNKDLTNGQHVDQFGLPNLNQLALVDIEDLRGANGNSSSITMNDVDKSRQPTNNNTILSYIGRNTNAIAPPNLIDSNVNISFTIEKSNQLSGKITGMGLSDPAYFDTIFVVPRKLGIQHTPVHSHRPDQGGEFTGVESRGENLMEFLPGMADYGDHGPNDYEIAEPDSPDNTDVRAQSFKPGAIDLTWYDPDAPQDYNVIGSSRKYFEITENFFPLAGDRTIPRSRTTLQHTNTGAIAGPGGNDTDGVGSSMYTGAFPPAGYYTGERNYYATTDIPAFNRGSTMPLVNIEDTADNSINTAVTDTYTTTLNHSEEAWSSNNLRSHTHDAFEITMGTGLRIPDSMQINNIQTSSAVPVDVDTALTIQMNPNTPSLTIMYIIRAF